MLRARYSPCDEKSVEVWTHPEGIDVGATTLASLILRPHDDAKRLPIFPVLLGEAGPEALPTFLRLFQATSWNGSDTLPERLLEQIRKRAIVAGETAVFEGCPLGARTSRARGGLAHCSDCGSEWDGDRTAPVRSFEPNTHPPEAPLPTTPDRSRPSSTGAFPPGFLERSSSLEKSYTQGAFSAGTEKQSLREDVPKHVGWISRNAQCTTVATKRSRAASTARIAREQLFELGTFQVIITMPSITKGRVDLICRNAARNSSMRSSEAISGRRCQVTRVKK